MPRRPIDITVPDLSGRRAVITGASNLSHPGVAPTNLLASRPEVGRDQDTRAVRMIRALSARGILVGTVHTAQLPALYAATSPDAERGGVALGTDRLLVQLADVEFRLGNPARARDCRAEAARVAEAAGTGAATVGLLVARAIVDDDATVAETAVRLAMERGQPLELAVTVDRLASRGFGSAGAIAHAYELLGELDAVLYRAWLRNVMRERDIRVPGRARTVGENERLLAGLVADGLSNKELATALRTSEKSVEGRLSRLFTRTGYQSRVALAAAVHSGEFQP